jgi:uncharacterized repeat protein (TIGR03803 family)
MMSSASPILAAGLLCAGLAAMLPAPAGASSYQTLYSFTNGKDGGQSSAPLAIATDGKLYGTTYSGGAHSYGTVFSLTPPATGKTPWTESVLYSFTGAADGANPAAGLLLKSGSLYGTATFGGDLKDCAFQSGCGVVFALTPPAKGSSAWTETAIDRLAGPDGDNPEGGLAVGSAGQLYGTARYITGASCCGAVFKLTPPAAGKSVWGKTVLHAFTTTEDATKGAFPYAGMIADKSGALYGTLYARGKNVGKCAGGGCGAVFKLTPPAKGKTAWTESTLHLFGSSDGGGPLGALVMDKAGALYGTTNGGGTGACKDGGGNNIGCGVVFKLTPPAAGKTVWTETVLHVFAGGKDGGLPAAGPVLGTAGVLYVTTTSGGTGLCGAGTNAPPISCGTIVKLTPPASAKGAWSEKVIYDFTGGLDGAAPLAPVVIGSAGALYGTAQGGKSGGGVVFKFIP